MYDGEIRHCRHVTARFALASIVAMLVVPPLAGLRIDVTSFWPLAALIAVFGIFIPYTALRDMRRLRTALEVTVTGLFMTMPVLIFSYAAMRIGLPLADGSLAAADRALGFDWQGVIRAVDRHPRLAVALAYGYSSFSIQLLLLPILLALSGFEKRAYQMVAGYLLLCSAAIAISTFYPSLGAYEGHGFDGKSLSSINSHFGYFFLRSFAAVRGDPDFTLTLSSAAGIITFPSIHAGVALLCAWAGWALRPLRLPILALNVLMACSAVTHGGHYAIDVIAGLAVAAAAIAVVIRLTDLSTTPSRASDQRTAAMTPA